MSLSSYDQQQKFNDFLKNMENDIFANPETSGSKPGEEVKESSLQFNMKPEELESYLNKYVVGQEEAIEVISTKVCTHFNRMRLEKNLKDDERVIGNIKSNILLIGPTGVGKTYIIKLIANKIGVPFVKADATKFSETGYVGGDVEDLVRELVHEAGGEISHAEYGIIYLDEIDKIASAGNSRGIDVSRSGVQRNLLKLMEEADVDLKTPHDLASQVEAAMEAQRTGHVKRKKINTKNILFIVSGAFSGLDDIIKKRKNMQAIGFEGSSKFKVDPKENEILKDVKTEDLLTFGFESEFIGRLPVTVVLNDVNKDVLFKILKNRYSSVINGKKMDFRAYDIELEFSDEALRILARRAAEEHTGARGLLNVFEKVLMPFEKIMPSLHYDKLVVDEDLVNDPQTKLRQMLLTDNIKGFQSDFFVSNNIYLEFENDAVEMIVSKAKDQNKSIKRVCEDLFHDYNSAINLMKMDRFTITAAAVANPSGYIENYIRDFFKRSESDTSNKREI